MFAFTQDGDGGCSLASLLVAMSKGWLRAGHGGGGWSLCPRPRARRRGGSSVVLTERVVDGWAPSVTRCSLAPAVSRRRCSRPRGPRSEQNYSGSRLSVAARRPSGSSQTPLCRNIYARTFRLPGPLRSGRDPGICILTSTWEVRAGGRQIESEKWHSVHDFPARSIQTRTDVALLLPFRAPSVG